MCFDITFKSLLTFTETRRQNGPTLQTIFVSFASAQAIKLSLCIKF